MRNSLVNRTWKLGLALFGFRRGGAWKEADEADLVPDQNRIDYHRQDGVEWYVNSPAGLKHGFTLYAPPVPGEDNDANHGAAFVFHGSSTGLNLDGIDSIYFARVSTTGGLLSPETRITTPGQARFPAIAWNGVSFGLAWYEYRTELANWEVYSAPVDCCEDDDGIDNQCPGDAGFGLVDEISGVCGYRSSGSDTMFSWPGQAEASLYEVARSTYPDFSGSCTLFQTADTFWNDTETPPAGQEYHYLVRALAPFAGSWGEDATGAERLNVCP